MQTMQTMLTTEKPIIIREIMEHKVGDRRAAKDNDDKKSGDRRGRRGKKIAERIAQRKQAVARLNAILIALLAISTLAAAIMVFGFCIYFLGKKQRRELRRERKRARQRRAEILDAEQGGRGEWR